MFTEINTQKKENGNAKKVMVYPSKYDIDTGKQTTVEAIIKDIRAKISRDFIEKKTATSCFFQCCWF